MLIGEREVFNHSKCVFTRLIRPIFITWKHLFVMNCLVGFNILNNAVVYLVAVLLLGYANIVEAIVLCWLTCVLFDPGQVEPSVSFS